MRYFPLRMPWFTYLNYPMIFCILILCVGDLQYFVFFILFSCSFLVVLKSRKVIILFIYLPFSYIDWHRAIQKSNCYHREGHNAPCAYGDTKHMLLFGAVQVVMSQIPDFHNMEWLSVIAAIMSFAYSFIGFGLGFAKVIGKLWVSLIVFQFILTPSTLESINHDQSHLFVSL